MYGVNTGMGALAGVRLDAAEQAEQSRRLLVGRAVGGPPWLSRTEARAVVAVRLRTFLSGDAGVSAELCAWLATLLAEDLVPAVPRSPSGSAGEIIPLAHAWGHLAGVGRMLDRRDDAVECRGGDRRTPTSPPRGEGGRGAAAGGSRRHGAGGAPGQRGARPAASVDHGRGRRGGARRRRSRPLSGRDGPRRRRPCRGPPRAPGAGGRGARRAGAPAGPHVVPGGGPDARPPGAQPRDARGRDRPRVDRRHRLTCVARRRDRRPVRRHVRLPRARALRGL